MILTTYFMMNYLKKKIIKEFNIYFYSISNHTSSPVC